MKQVVAIIFLFATITGCTEKKNFSGIIAKGKMEEIMWQLFQADAFTDQFVKKDSAKNTSLENINLQNRIFLLNNVTRESYYSSYNYYVAQPAMMKEILDSISARAERNRSKIYEIHSGSHSANSLK